MTCIVGLVTPTAVIIGADSAGVAGDDITIRKDSKVFKLKGSSGEEMVIGFTSSFRMGQLLQYHLYLPPHDEGMDNFTYMVTEFIESVRIALKEGGYARKVNEEETGGCFLVGYRGCLYEIGSDFQVGECVHPYNAVGSGESYAKGAMTVLIAMGGLHPTTSPQWVVKMALLAACAHSGSVREPFNIIELPNAKIIEEPVQETDS